MTRALGQTLNRLAGQRASGHQASGHLASTAGTASSGKAVGSESSGTGLSGSTAGIGSPGIRSFGLPAGWIVWLDRGIGSPGNDSGHGAQASGHLAAQRARVTVKGMGQQKKGP
ncbi:unnamed protein product, partial [Staurois parvus]